MSQTATNHYIKTCNLRGTDIGCTSLVSPVGDVCRRHSCPERSSLDGIMTVVWVPDLGYSSPAVPLRERGLELGQSSPKEKGKTLPQPTKRSGPPWSHTG